MRWGDRAVGRWGEMPHLPISPSPINGFRNQGRKLIGRGRTGSIRAKEVIPVTFLSGRYFQFMVDGLWLMVDGKNPQHSTLDSQPTLDQRDACRRLQPWFFGRT